MILMMLTLCSIILIEMLFLESFFFPIWEILTIVGILMNLTSQV